MSVAMAEEIVDANAEFIAFVEGCSDDEWRAICRAEKWRGGAVGVRCRSRAWAEAISMAISPACGPPFGVEADPILQPTNPPSQKGVNCAGTGHHPGSRGRASPWGVQRKGADVRWRPVADSTHARGVRPLP